MTRIATSSLLAVLCACGPSVSAGDGSGSASSEESGADASSSSEESGAPPVTCRELPAALEPLWSSIVDPDTLTDAWWSAATAEGGAVLASRASMVTLDASGTAQAVQWFGPLVPTNVAFADDGQIWIASSDVELVVTRHDASGELARGTRPRQGEEYVVDILPEPGGGALLLSVGESVRLERIGDDMTFGEPSTIGGAEELQWVELGAGGLVLATTRDTEEAALTAFDMGGTQLWRTALPVPFFEQSLQITSQSAVGDVVYTHVAQVDYAESPPRSSYWLFGTGRDDGTLRFELTTDGGTIATTPCGGLYRIGPWPLPDEPPRAVLVEYDALGQIVGEIELAIPAAPEGFVQSVTHGIAVANDGSILVHGQLDSLEGGDPLQWAARY